MVITDVLMRTVEADGGQMAWACELPDPTPEHVKALQALMAALGAHPPSGFTASGESLEDLGDAADVHVFADGRRNGEQGVWLEVGSTSGAWAQQTSPVEGEDPLAVRLTLLGQPYRRPATLTPHDIRDSERTLLRWRHQVAQWACLPSKPVPEEIRRRADDALAADLATPDVLKLLLCAEAADDIPEGAKFETFAHLDRILGLELTREIGRAPVPVPEAG